MSPTQLKHSTRVEILVKKGQEELLTDKLYQLAGKGFWVEDQGNLVLLKCYPDEPDALLEGLLISGLKIIHVNVEREESRDYTELTRQYFRPIRIGDLTVRAPWNKKRGNSDEIIIEPGMAFGTGRHESTRIMIKLMKSVDMKGKKVLDIGCGSGILALYAHLLEARKVIAVDSDLDAVQNAKKNFTLNNALSIESVCANLQDIFGSFDVVLANIDINTFSNYSEHVAGMAENDGVLIISGILKRDKGRLLRLFHNWNPVGEYQKNSWCGFLLTR